MPPLTLSDDQLAELKRAVDIVDLIGSSIVLKRSGRAYTGLCPFHDDHRPSFSVYPERQTFKCWSCGVGGDAISFVQNRERVGFLEAVRMLAERAGISLGRDERALAAGMEKSALYAVLKWAEDEYHRCLLLAPLAQAARDYLRERGIAPASSERFKLGFAPNQRDWLLSRARAAGHAATLLEKAGLAAQSSSGRGHYDRFRGRIIFPIHEGRGKTIGFGGRILPAVEAEHAAARPEARLAKYLNSPETPVFQKSQHLYALDLARASAVREGRIVVVEGYTDCILAHQAGVECVVGALGTALGERHVRELQRVAKRIILVLDGDEAGQKAMDRSLGLFISQNVDLRILRLPDGLDPADFLLQQGGVAFRELLESARDALEYKLERVHEQFDLSSLEGRGQAIENVVRILAMLPALKSEEQRVRQELILARLAQSFGIGEGPLRHRLSELRRQAQERQAPGRGKPRPAPGTSDSLVSPTPPAARAEIDRAERDLFEALLNEPDCVARVVSEFGPEQIRSEELRRILSALKELCRQGEEPTVERLLNRLREPVLVELATTLAETGQGKGDARRRIADALLVVRGIRGARRDAEASRLRAELSQAPVEEENRLLKLIEERERQRAARNRQLGKEAI